MKYILKELINYSFGFEGNTLYKKSIYFLLNKKYENALGNPITPEKLIVIFAFILF